MYIRSLARALPVVRGILLAALLVFCAEGVPMAATMVSNSDKHAWSENAGWLNFRSAHGGMLVDVDHLSGYAWLENIGWLKLGSEGAGPYANTSARDWGVNLDGAGKLTGYAWSETFGWINFKPSGGGVTFDATSREFSGDAWGENIGWVQLRSPSGAPVEFKVAATSSSSGNISSNARFAWSENTGWLNYRPTDGGMTVHADHLSGYIWMENLGWLKMGADGAGPYGNSTSANWGVNRDLAGNLSGKAWSEGWGWIDFAPANGGVSIEPEGGGFYGYAWGENIGWINFASPENAAVGYNVGLAVYTLNLKVAGDGGGTVVSATPPFSCNTNCSKQVLGDTTVRLSAAPSEYSLFNGWSGCDSASGSYALVTMNRDRETTVTFNKDTIHVTRVDGLTPVYFPTVQQAYDSPASSDRNIRVWGQDLSEKVICRQSKTVSITGGFNQEYDTRPGRTTIRGLTIGKGTVRVNGVVIR